MTNRLACQPGVIMKRYRKYLGRDKIKTKRDIKSYIAKRLLRHEFMLRRARQSGLKGRPLAIIHAQTRELRIIFDDLFRGDADEETTGTSIK
tara:strand:+ start:555 stop:830 length:276 start_codon:yes stop_codon:yes gene_type:complete